MGSVNNNWIVAEGVKVGDKIVTTGVQKVIPGAKVRIVAKAEDAQVPVKKPNIFVRIFNKIKRFLHKG